MGENYGRSTRADVFGVAATRMELSLELTPSGQSEGPHKNEMGKPTQTVFNTS